MIRLESGRAAATTLPGERRPRCAPALLLLLCALAAPGRAAAQEPIIPLQLSFSDPGARSMGFGGAFVALADDATAAFSNPAGLVQLTKPEVSLEGRHWSYSTPYAQRGRVEGLPSGVGADTVAGLRMARSNETIAGLAFLSVAYPKGRWSFALFRHQWADFEFASETRGLFAGTERRQERFFDQRATSELEFASYGLSAATRIGERLAVGFGVAYHDISLGALSTVYLPDEDPVAGLLAPTSYLPERSLLIRRVEVEEGDWGLIGGFLWRLSESWRIGGVYRQGPSAGIVLETRAGRAVDFGVPPGGLLWRTEGSSVELPWVLGLGVAYRAPDGGLTVSFQWDRIAYTTITDSLARLAASIGADPEQGVDDANELHLGGEYVFLGSTPVVAVRIGAWLDPDHFVRDTSGDKFLSVLQPPGEDQVHLTLGFGVALERFQIDFGLDLADQVDTASVSAVYSF